MHARIEPGIRPAEAVALAKSADWEWTEPWVARFLAVATGFTARAQDGRALGIVTVVLWDDLAWLGSMAIAPEARRQGIGRALLRHAIAHAEARGASSIGLDASPSPHGRRLYEQEGFVAFGESWLSEREGPMPATFAEGLRPSEHAIYPVSPAEVMELLACDQPRFGASRGPLLAKLMAMHPQQAFVAVHRRTGAFSGHAFAFRDRIGPLVADTPQTAAWLLHALERARTPAKAIVAHWNADAKALFDAAGYRPVRACLRMWRGPVLGRPETQHCPASWALG